MFSNIPHIQFRQRLVILVGFGVASVMLAAAYSHHEIADVLNYEVELNEMADHYEGIERTKQKIKQAMENDPETMCCAIRRYEPLDRDLDEGREIKPVRMWFLDPADIARANLPKEFKEGKYLLFQNEKGDVTVLDLSNPLRGYSRD
jgi:hypothetical protein